MKSAICALYLVVASLLLLARPGESSAAAVSDFADFSLRSGATTLLPGRLYVPPEASNLAAARPFILFLHGGGETGTDNARQINQNIDNLLAEAKRRGAFLYAPQSTGPWADTALTANVMTMIDRAISDFNVNSTRLYVTGLSNGGGGTWNMLSRFPTRFAAGIPICAVSPTGFVAANLVNQAIAAFHARDDSIVSFSTSRNVINQILTAGSQPLPLYPDRRSTADYVFSSPALDLNYIEFGSGNHGIWFGVYNTPPLYDWMFSHSTPEPSTLVVALMACSVMAMASRSRRLRLQNS